VTLVPVPLPMRASSAASDRYELAGELTFRDAAGLGGRVTRLSLVVLDGAGDRTIRQVETTVEVPASGSAAYRLAAAVDGPIGPPPFTLRLESRGVDASGRPFSSPPLEVALVRAGPIATAPASDAVVVAAGDIAVCGAASTEATARLLDRTPGTVLTLGDHVYPTGSAEQFARCYEPTWGRHRARTRPAPGNHDWEVDAGAPYFAQFGPAAGPHGVGYYAYELGAWRVLSLNSNVPANPGSDQYEWARNTLSTGVSFCTLAYWHHPLFSSGPNGNNAQMRQMWRLLQSHGVDVVLVGHDHDYERFAPQDADGRADPHGIREFVVGTGGVNLYAPRARQPNSEVLETSSWGVLKLALKAGGYDWEFMPIDGQSFRDFGAAACTP
jgi:hypothetical protein